MGTPPLCYGKVRAGDEAQSEELRAHLSTGASAKVESKTPALFILLSFIASISLVCKMLYPFLVFQTPVSYFTASKFHHKQLNVKFYTEFLVTGTF